MIDNKIEEFEDKCKLKIDNSYDYVCVNGAIIITNNINVTANFVLKKENIDDTNKEFFTFKKKINLVELYESIR